MDEFFLNLFNLFYFSSTHFVIKMNVPLFTRFFIRSENLYSLVFDQVYYDCYLRIIRKKCNGNMHMYFFFVKLGLFPLTRAVLWSVHFWLFYTYALYHISYVFTILLYSLTTLCKWTYNHHHHWHKLTHFYRASIIYTLYKIHVNVKYWNGWVSSILYYIA